MGTPKRLLLAAAAVALCALAVWTVPRLPEKEARQAGEAFLRQVFTAAPQDAIDPDFFTRGLESRYRELVTDDLWRAGMANRTFATYSLAALEQEASYTPGEIRLDLSQKESGRYTYLFDAQVEAVPRDGSSLLSAQATGVLVMVREEDRWLADYLVLN